MLVLSRKKNESIVINNDIVITVVEIRGDKVRLGIVAPKDVPVHREEGYEAIHGVKAAPPSAVKTDTQPRSRRPPPLAPPASPVLARRGQRPGRRPAGSG